MTGNDRLCRCGHITAQVADLTDDCGAVHADQAEPPKTKPEQARRPLPSVLRSSAGGADELGARPHVVDDGTNGHVGGRR